MTKVLSIVLCVFLAGSTQLFSQRHHGNAHRGAKTTQVHHRGNKVVKVHKYPRKKVIVVKPRKVRAVNALPVGYSTVVFRGKNYHYHGGHFYNHVGSVYNIILPPVGIRIKSIPAGHRRIIIGGLPHYYYMGVYYKEVAGEYETVEPTVGTIVPELPSDNVDEITIDGQTYYEFDSMLYKSIVTSSGPQYELVGKLDD